MMVKFHYPDGDWCYRGLQTVHAVFHDADGKLIARAEKGDLTGYYEFEITGFELVGTGEVFR